MYNEWVWGWTHVCHKSYNEANALHLHIFYSNNYNFPFRVLVESIRRSVVRSFRLKFQPPFQRYVECDHHLDHHGLRRYLSKDKLWPFYRTHRMFLGHLRRLFLRRHCQQHAFFHSQWGQILYPPLTLALQGRTQALCSQRIKQCL